MQKKLKLIVIALFITISVFAQSKQGIVLDEKGFPIIGAIVTADGGNVSTKTDFDGKYWIKVPDGTKVTITYVGYSSKTVEPGGTTHLELLPSFNDEDDDDSAFTFTEAQLGEDDNTLNTISIVGSNNNVYAKEVGYRFSAARFKYRALGGKYNEMYINGNPVNDVERGEFNFSYVGGLNNQTRSADHALPFEDTNYAMTALGGSNNYNFRPSSMPAGHRLSLSGANRNYTLRGMYSYNSGVSEKGWVFSGALTYRWANMETANIEGTFYNALSYYLGVEKIINKNHSVSLVTWGNPTERAAQSASTDEMYWMANSNFYNPNWGYQNGEKRSSRIVNSYAPSALLTWDFKISDKTKLETTLLGKYSMYSSSRLNYNNSTNPAPDYYSSMPSYFFDVYNPPTTWGIAQQQNLANWQSAYNYFTASKANRQINWDRLYEANKGANEKGLDAMYYLQAYHDDQLAFSLASHLNHKLTKNSTLNLGIQFSTNKGMHYQTLEDKLGADSFRNINTYVAGTYGENSATAMYDMNEPAGKQLNVGDRFAYDYNIFVNKATLWAGYSLDWKSTHFFAQGRMNGTTIQREGKMRNGLAPDNSYGDGGKAKFLDGGGKVGAHINLGKGNTIVVGGSFEWKAPTARNAFISPQVNNDFVHNLKLEQVMGAELGYQLQTTWMQANLTGYYARMNDVTEYSMAYNDIQHSFSYISLTGINKEYYGAELGLNFKVTESFSIKALGTISEAKYANNADVVYMLSEDGKYTQDICINKGMREGNTPLAAASIDLSYRVKGWYIDVIGNYFDKIYLYYSPITRYYNDLPTLKDANGNIQKDVNGNPMHDTSKVPDQAKGNGGFMLDLSIGKSIYLKKGRSLAFNLMLTNVLNNTKICTGGMEQNRRSTDENGEDTKTYKFDKNPKKFYANGINGMLNVTYKF